MPRSRSLLPALVLLAGTGCYTLQEVTAAPTPGAALEVTLTDAGTAAVTAVVGPRARRISGVTAAATPDTIHLELSQVLTEDGQAYFLQGATVALARTHLASIRARRLDRGRTAILTAAGVLAAGAIITAVRLGGGGDDNTGGGGGGGPALVPPPR